MRLNPSRLIIALLMLSFLPALVLDSGHGQAPVIVRVFVDNEGEPMDIDPGAADLIQRGINEATGSQANFLVIQLNTLGGFLRDTEKIANDVTAARTDVHVVVYIPPGGSAFSAGAYVSVASDTLAMDAGTAIGSAEPRPFDEKVANAVAAKMASLAEATGKNGTTVRRFVTENLDLTAEEAASPQFGVANFTVNGFNDLMARLNAQNANVIEVRPSLITRFISTVSDPLISFLFFITGIILILLDVFHPTFIMGGIGVALVILALFGFGYFGMPLLSILLFVIGAGVIFLELKAGHGGLAIAGVILGLAGVILAYNIAEPFATSRSTALTTYALAGATVFIAAFSGLYINKIRTTLKMRKPLLDPREMIGHTAVVREDITPLKPGVVFLQSDLWTATSDETIPAGEKVRVISVEGNRVKVAKEPPGGLGNVSSGLG